MALALVVGMAMRAKAQDNPAPVDTGTCVLGTDQGGDGRPHPCSDFNRSRGSSSSNTYSGPSAADIEAQRAREAEQARLADAQRRLAEQQRRDAERREQEHKAWMDSVAAAAGDLKGVSTDDMGLKGVGGNTNFFGLKGVSPDEAGSMIKTGEPEGTPHSVTGAWQQLHCAAELANDAVADLKKIESGEAGASELDEIHFVAGQAGAVMHGGQVTVDTSTCAGAGPMPVKLSSADLARETPVIDRLLTRTVHDADTYVAAQQKADALRQKLDALKAQHPAPAAQQPASASNPTAASSPASTAQSPPISTYQQQINAAVQQQKAYQKSHADYYALLLATQRALNEANSQKISSQADADKVPKETQAIMAGQFTATSTSVQSQTQKKQPGDEQ